MADFEVLCLLEIISVKKYTLCELPIKPICMMTKKEVITPSHNWSWQAEEINPQALDKITCVFLFLERLLAS